MNRLWPFFPISALLARYNEGDFKWDLIAGITLASFLVPESMAYASLAGLPPQYGIYCCIAGGLLFAVLTNARQLAIGPTSAIALMVGTTALTTAGQETLNIITIASMTAFMVFVFCIIAYFLQLSSLVNFISDSILVGFKTGAALVIASTQLPLLFGYKCSGVNFFDRIYNLLINISHTNFSVLAFGLIALALLTAGHRFFPERPFVLIIFVGSIIISRFAGQHYWDLNVVGQIPGGFPRLTIPTLSFSEINEIIALSFGCLLIGYIETISTARILSEKNRYELDSRHELLSFGAANLAVSFLGGIPVAGGLSQSTVNDRAGARTPLALIICSFVLLILMVWFTGLLSNLPEVILAVVVLDAMRGLVGFRDLKRLRSLSKTEYYVALTAILAVLTFGLLKGILIGAVISLASLLVRASKPKVAILGRIPGTNMFTDIHRHPDNQQITNCHILRIETSIFYFNQQHIYNNIIEIIRGTPSKIKLLILDMSSSPSIDVSGAKMLLKLSLELEKQNISLRIVEALSEVRELLRKLDLEKVIGHISRKLSIQDAIDDFQRQSGTIST